MGDIWIYGHSGSRNHGNEAIVRGVCGLLNESVKVVTTNIESDKEVGLDKICQLYELRDCLKKYSIINLLGALAWRIRKDDKLRLGFRYKEFYQDIKEGDIFMFEAGDQCFETKETLSYYYYLSKNIKKRKAKLVFLCGSIPKDKISALMDFLSLFDEILVRESISYEALINTALHERTHLIPCPAFSMVPKEHTNIDVNREKKYVGIVVGYLLQGKEEYSKKLYNSVVELIEYIIQNTDYNIMLIPHVNVAEKLSDVKMEKEIEAKFSSDRIIRLDEMPADIIKFYIGSCEMLITVRTHASIAAYSSCVPTLVIGYSQKSIGIATDLFGNTKWVADLHNLSGDSLIGNFIEFESAHQAMREELQRKIPEYLKTHAELQKLVSRK